MGSNISLRYFAIFIVLFGSSSLLYGQTPSAVANFEGHTGLLIPRMSTVDILSIEDPVDGLLVYDSTLAHFYYYSSLSESWQGIRVDEGKNATALRSAENLQTPHQPSLQAKWNVEGNIGADTYSSDPPLVGNVDSFPVVFITSDNERMRILADGNIVVVRSLEIGENLNVKQNVDLNALGGETINHGPFTVTNQSPTVLTGSLTSERNVNLNALAGQTMNFGPFTVTNQSATLLTGPLTVDQKTRLKLGLEVYEPTTLHGLFEVDNGYASLLTGLTTISDPTESPSTQASAGAMVVSGGAGIGKNLYVGGNFDVAGAAAFGGPVAFASPVTISATEESTSTSTGALIVAGGAGISKRINVGGETYFGSTLDVGAATTLNNTLDVGGATTLSSSLDVTGATNLDKTLGVTGATNLNSTLGVTGATNLNSTLGVTGATNLSSTLGVAGSTSLQSTLGVSQATTVESTLSVAGDYTINTNKFSVLSASGNTTVAGTLGVNGAATLNNTLNVIRGTKFGSTLAVTGATVLSSDLTVKGATSLGSALTVTANLPGTQSSFDAYPLKVKGGRQGIGIAVNGSRGNANNFVSFWDNNGTNMLGRIEGQKSSEFVNDPEYNRLLGQLDLNVTLAEIGVATATLGIVDATATAVSYYTSTTVCSGFGICITVPIPSFSFVGPVLVVLSIAQEVLAVARLVYAKDRRDTYKNLRSNNEGVTFQSGAGDYAEWLPKSSGADRIMPGFVVGMKKGKISLMTEGADKILAISTNPIVLGNMPLQGQEEEFEKVAFMGQVPVRVFGPVTVGDYILPSGNNDGFAKAVHPSHMTAQDYSKIVGVAWSSSQNDVYNLINVAIGLNDGDISKLASKQSEEIKELSEDVRQLQKEEMDVDAALSQLIPDYQKTLSSLKNEVELAEVAIQHDQAHVRKPDDVIEISTPDPNSLVYFEFTREHILRSIDLTEKMFVENGGDVSTHAFWTRIKSDASYRDEVANRTQRLLQESMNNTFKLVNQGTFKKD